MKISDEIIIEFDMQSKNIRILTPDSFAIEPENITKDYWIHCDLNHPKIYHLLAKKLSLPAHVKALCKQSDTIPHLTDMNETITFQIECPMTMKLIANEEMEFSTLIFHLTPHYCFTATRKKIPAITEFIGMHHHAIQFAQTPCFILFLICENVINDYSAILFNEEIITDEMELEVRKLHKNIYQDVVDIKQQLMKVKRNLVGIREIITRISDRKIEVISAACRESLHYIANHSHNLIHEADSIRDLLKDLLAQIDNALMQNLNETMRILTAFAAIFLPLSLITGIYGMNFEKMPELHWTYGYYYALSLIVGCGLLLFYIFKKKKWF
jgi:magnesium transporter